ncbi:MAG: hypothetical protein IJ386_03105 [Clostridia bacterium]|nr:hypothetical protein [Clostridia bacterium]
MTINRDNVTLWDGGTDKFCAVSIPEYQQYLYIDGKPCITVGFTYENANFKGYDYFTFFDTLYTDLMASIKSTSDSLSGSFRLYDMGCDTDGYIDFVMDKGKVNVSGQLGATFNTHWMHFAFDADQTLITALYNCIKI